MKSGPWNLRGLRPQAREAAHDAARRSGVSVGEWLNSVIESDDGEYGAPRHPHREDDRYDEPPRRYREDRPRNDERREPRPRREAKPDLDRVVARARAEIRETARAEAHREAMRTREDIGEVHARLDRLTQQLERLNELRTSAPARPPAFNDAARPDAAPLTGAPPRRAPTDQSLSIEDAVAEITARQRALDGGEAARPASRSPNVDFGGLENQLRQITARIDALQPSRDIEKAIAAVRTDLSEIGRQLTEALPRRAVESLEIEVKALAERIDHSRQAGADGGTLAGLEHGLAEVREALRRLTPAENLVGFEEAVHALAQKVDLIIAKEDPGALQQLEAAIGGLRSIVSHVASNDTLTGVAEDVRALAAQVDGIANSAATGHAVSAIEQRLDTLTAALNASSEAGHAVPRELEKLLAGLIEKLEWVQLTHTDHAALAHLEDRIASLVKRFDASDARLGHLEAIERGLADLLVHLEHMRGGAGGSGSAAAGVSRLAPAVTQAIEREVAEIKESERRTQDSLEAVHGTVEDVVDRLATIESGIRGDTASGPALPSRTPPAGPEPVEDDAAPDHAPAIAASAPAASPPPARRAAAVRPPIDPSLPPDHPLEPGSATNRTRPLPSAADRVAASEAAIASAKPPVISDSGRPNFIAAARRAAQAAAWEPSGHQPDAESDEGGKPVSLSQRLRKLIVAGGAVLVVLGCVRIAVRLVETGGPTPMPQAQSEQIPNSAQAATPAPDSPRPLPPEGAPMALPNPAAPRPAKTARPARQSLLNESAASPEAHAGETRNAEPPVAAAAPSWAAPDITGALPNPAVEAPVPAPAPAPVVGAPLEEKLPASIGDPALRAAAMSGNPAAAYEVATRFAEGRGVGENSAEAARWFERAAAQGLAPAEFRLGGLYEKGIGVKKDLVRARDLYLAAAEKGNGKAMHNLAVLYAEGINGSPDYDNAAIWFRRAAEHGVEDSQYNLGILYARGIGVTQNYAEAYKWFALAAIQGDREAGRKRDEVAAHLDAQSLAAAREAVQKWTPQPQPDDAVNVKTAAWNPPSKAAHPAKPKPRPAAHHLPELGSAVHPD